MILHLSRMRRTVKVFNDRKNLNGIRRKEPILAIIYDGGGGVRMLLSVWAADQAAEISYGFSLDLRLIKLVPVNYCFYKKMNS